MHLEDNVGTIQFKEKRTALSAQKEQSIVSINGVSKVHGPSSLIEDL